MDAQTLNELLMSSSKFKQNLTSLCASSEPDKLEILATIILGVWMGNCKKIHTVIELLQQVENTRPNFLAQKIEGVIWLPQSEKILQAISNFKYSIKNGYFNWNYNNGLETGMLDYLVDSQEFMNFQHILISKSPKSFTELEEVLL